ncbi:MAG: hypothetical protein JWO42_681 [Chloroflexi bacterium]|nr:hypothetical protein [Chloroflexota bacterium]
MNVHRRPVRVVQRAPLGNEVQRPTLARDGLPTSWRGI